MDFWTFSEGTSPNPETLNPTFIGAGHSWPQAVRASCDSPELLRVEGVSLSACASRRNHPKHDDMNKFGMTQRVITALGFLKSVSFVVIFEIWW